MPVHFDAQHPALQNYYARRKEIDHQGATKETSIRDAFATLLQVTGKANGMTLVLEHRVGGMKKVLLPDGTLNDIETRYPRGYWEAKDARDVLEVEIQKKRDRGYPTSNTIFEDSKRAILYQHHKPVGEYRLDEPTELALLLNTFYSYTEPAFDTFKQAIERFKEDTKSLAAGLHARISQSHKDNSAFKQAFDTFMEQCRRDLNPKITREQVDDMLIQHLMTERLIRSLFQSDFAKRNIIAAEVEKVITALTSRSFDPKEYLGPLEYFYSAVESAAKNLANFAEKQTFLNDVYEQFFQRYSLKTADTHGIVYTPQPIVEFMVALVEDALHREFGYGLDHPHVCLIDPCTGTGNFIVQLLRRMALRSYDPNDLLRFYQDRLFANEIMLLPYYLASLNIERTYYELTGEYRSFEGLCFVDTLDLAKKRQQELLMISEKNAERVERQQRAPITVIIGNPPYNVGQKSENDNNKNRTYAVVEERLRETYIKDSTATLRMQLYDPYVKFFRWAADRLQGRDGIVCYVSNNSFVDQVAFDGMRKHLLQEFTHIYHLDLHGNVRQNPKISGTSHNVFGIQIGVGITLAIRSQRIEGRGLHYHRVPEMWRREDKLGLLAQITSPVVGETLLHAPQTTITPDARHNWIISNNADEYASFIPMGTKEAKRQRMPNTQTIFKDFSTGVMTGRDSVVYDVDKSILEDRIKQFSEDYDTEVFRFKRKGQSQSSDDFLGSSTKIK